jgi:hydroxymethylpyrimidine/phosphomethylpyrimidine kinase
LSLANACEAGIDYVARGLQQGYAPGRSEVLVLDHFGAAPHA